MIELTIKKEIDKIQAQCNHANASMEGWEGGRYSSCPECGYDS